MTNNLLQRGQLFYIDEQGNTFDLLIDSTGDFYQNNQGQDTSITAKGRAFYTDFKDEQRILDISPQNLAKITLDGKEYIVGEN